MRVSDWLRPMLRTWGQQRRRILTGRRQFRDGGVHVDGHPTMSTTGLVREGGSSGKVEQHFAEVYTGDGLEIWRALDSAPLHVRGALHVHYVVGGLWTEKAQALGLERQAYYDQLGHAERWLAEKLEIKASVAVSA